MAAVACILAAGAAPPPGLVHTRLESSVPADGDTLAQMPARVELRFSGSVDPALSEYIVVTPAGDSLHVALESGADGDGVLEGAAPDLPAGRHSVLWRTVSADGHPVSGGFSFVVSGAPPAARALERDGRDSRDSIVTRDRGPDAGGEGPSPGAGGEGPSPGAVALAAVATFCLLGFAGLLWHCGSLPLIGEPRINGTVRALGWAALALGLVDLASWTLRVVPAGAGPSAYGAALGSPTGLVGGAGLGLTAVAIALLARRPRGAAGAALAAVLIGAAAGHPAAFSPWLTMPANALHLGAATIWLGGLLLLVTIPDGPTDASAGWTLAGAARSVSASALLAVILIGASGMIQSIRFVGDIGAVASTPYGRGVLVKSAGLLVLIGFGAFHRLRVLPGLETAGGRRLRRTVLVEMIVMLIVVLVAVWLARVPPPAGH